VPIIDVQRRYRELGRLRLGKKGAKGNPVRLGTWRFTSPDRRLLDAAAGAFGGEVVEWTGAPTEGEQWELVSEAKELRVYVPPQDLASSMYYELWTRGGVKRRCDGETEYLAGVDCICAREGKKTCSITTHLAVMLPQLPDVGVWRVRTSSWNAAAEIPSTVDLLQRIHDEGALPLAILGIESRTVVSEGQTKHFALPVLKYPSSIAEAEAAGIPILSHRREAPALEAGRPELPADARFDRDRAEWGDPLDIPAPAEVAKVEPAGENVEEVGASEESDKGSDEAERKPPTVSGEGETASEAPPLADPGSGGDAEEGRVPDPDPWIRLQGSLDRIGDDGVAAVRRHAISHRWGWKPEESWPADRLEALAEVAREWEAS
jgi:hypothetical protein